MFELTGAVSMIVPFMVAIQIAKWTGDVFTDEAFDRSQTQDWKYDQHSLSFHFNLFAIDASATIAGFSNKSQIHINQDFLQLPRAIPSSRVLRVANRNSHAVKATPSRKVNETLDTFFAPYNAQLYAWMEMQGRQFKPWD